jgi:hypothetical protein
MGVAVSRVRPSVLSGITIKALDEYLRFRHVVRNVYAFEFDVERIEHLTQGSRLAFEKVRNELSTFAEFLERVAREDSEDNWERDQGKGSR